MEPLAQSKLSNLVVSSFYHFYAQRLNTLFNVLLEDTPVEGFLHEHTGAHVDNIHAVALQVVS